MKELHSSLYLKLLETMSDNYAVKIVEELREAIQKRENVDITLVGSPDLLETALVGTGLYFGDDWKTNGWEVDYWGSIYDENTDEKVAEVSGSMYYGNLSIDFEYEK